MSERRRSEAAQHGGPPRRDEHADRGHRRERPRAHGRDGHGSEHRHRPRPRHHREGPEPDPSRHRDKRPRGEPRDDSSDFSESDFVEVPASAAPAANPASQLMDGMTFEALGQEKTRRPSEPTRAASPAPTGRDYDVRSVKPPQHAYVIGDAGSEWRMMQLENVYRKARDSRLPVEQVAREHYGDDLRLFDEAREERLRLDEKSHRGEPVTGFMWREREAASSDGPSERPPASRDSLNHMQARLLKAKMRNDPDVKRLQAELDRALAERSEEAIPEMDMARHQQAGRHHDDMSIADMVKEERRTRLSANADKDFAATITRDKKFSTDLDYMDEHADRLAQRGQRKTINLRNTAIQDYKKTQRALEACPMCAQDERPPLCPIVATGFRVFLTLPSAAIRPYHCLIAPIEHRVNTLECDDDEWEEIRNFMKCLVQMFDARGQSVIFFEDASRPRRHLHTAIECVPVPKSVASLAPAFFREALVASDEEWSQHAKIIDTGARAQKGYGKQAFRRSLVKEMPYFHVWFDIDGGYGHVVENQELWGRDFARQVFASMMPGIDAHRGNSRWQSGDPRVEAFRKLWGPYDWTRILETS